MEHEYLVIEYGCVREIKEGIDKKNIKEIKIPDGVTEIGEYAFYNCTSLASVTIPASVTKISRVAFYGCNIKTVQYRGTLTQWCLMDNSRSLVKNAKTITMSDFADLKTMTTLAIPKGVTKIGRDAFRDCTSIASVTIPPSVTTISGSAFSGCKSLETVSIPASMTKIGGRAFAECNIKTVQYRGTLAQWCLMDNNGSLVTKTKTITMSDVVDLKSMTALAIPEDVTKIGASAFSGCNSLETVSIPAGVTKIGNNAFSGCESLASVIIPTSMTEIEYFAFKDCDNIKTVQYRGTLAQWCQIDNDEHLVKNAKTITMSDLVDLKAMTTLTIPDDVTKIGNSAFSGCESLTSVTIPTSMTEIGGRAFAECNIKTVQYGGTLAQWCQIDNNGYLVAKAKTITMSDIADLKTMTALAIPENVTKIGNSAFSGCKSLKNVTIPTNVTVIEENAFEDCDSLERVTIPAKVTKIGVATFRGCTSLKSVTIPESVTVIDIAAFSGCKSLKNVTIPASVTELCWWAFQDCESLREMKFLGTKAQWNSIDKGDDWNLNIPANKVVCANGEADLY